MKPPYNPIKPYPGSLDVCYDHEGESERVCVSPEIQFRTRSKVHWIPADPSKPGWRFHLLVEDGFAKHPLLNLLWMQTGLILSCIYQYRRGRLLHLSETRRNNDS